MRVIFAICAILFLTSLIPQTLPDIKREQVKEIRKSINYDSIIDEIVKDAKEIKEDRATIENNYTLINNLERSRSELRNKITKKISKIGKKSDTVYIVVQDTICLSCHNHLTINE